MGSPSDRGVLAATSDATPALASATTLSSTALFGVPVAALGGGRVHLGVPQPTYGRDGQSVRITSVRNPEDPGERELLGAVGQAHWSGHEGAWFVTVPGSGTGTHPGEDLDFEPVASQEEAAALEAHLARRRDPST